MNKMTKWLFLAVILGQSLLVFSGPLHDAAKVGNLDDVLASLDRGEDINAQDLIGITPLIWSAHGGHTEVVENLLDRGAKIEGKASDGRTALQLAIDANRINTVIALLVRGANIEAASYDQTPLRSAASSGEIEMIITLLTHGAKIEARDSKGRTALQLAARRPEVLKAIGEWLIENQKNITNPENIKILDLDVIGSFERNFKAQGFRYRQIKETMGKATGIPAPHPASIINHYLGIPEELQELKPGPLKPAHIKSAHFVDIRGTARPI